MALERSQVKQVLRYWLALLRQEEALHNRPKARPPVRAGFSVNLAEPRPGPTYFKLRPTEDVLGVLFRETESLLQGVDPERLAFFGQWLRTAYQREAAAKFGRTDPRQQRVFLGFVTLHDRRKGELACLLRFGANLSWRTAEGKPFAPPSYADRKARRLPEPPAHVWIDTDTPSDKVLPYLIDTQLLSRVLGVVDEEIAELFEVLREGEATPMQAVATITALLAAEDGWAPELTTVDEEADPAVLFADLLAAVKRRLPPGDITAYPVGLVADDGQLNATWHLQRELLDLLRAVPGTPPWGPQTPLWRYLSGDPETPARRMPRGLTQERALTAGQLDCARRFLANRLTAAQGPPGTGKTDLILNLVGDMLVDKLRPLLEGRSMGMPWMLVSSTNNRAVDNVLDALGRDTPQERLPMGLRVGSMDMTAQLGIEAINQARNWLGLQDSTDAEGRCATALKTFEEALAVVEQAFSPYEAARADAERKARLLARRAELSEAEDMRGTPEAVQLALGRLRAVQRAIEDVERIVESGKSTAHQRATAVWARAEKHCARFEESLVPLDLSIEVSLPVERDPEQDPMDEILEAWEDATTLALDRIEDIRDVLLKAKRGHHVARQRKRVDEELALIADSGALIHEDPPPMVAENAALYAAAVELRERWAIQNAKPLQAALKRAADHLAQRASLRNIFEKDTETSTWLRRLYPVLGCTLLSLGNALPAEVDVVDRAIIDEAGQCHPAYAVAGLMRAERALLIGDVHQLEPVVRLKAADEHRVRRAAQITLDGAELEPYRVFSERPASAQALGDRAVVERPALRDHFRCQPAIIAVSDALCDYRLTVHTPARSLEAKVPWLQTPLLFADVPGTQKRRRGSWENPAEVQVIMRLLESFARAGMSWNSIAVLTPYVAQLETLRQQLRQVGVPLDADRGIGADTPMLFDAGRLATGTVHRFQGGERTVIILSTVVTTQRSLGFLDGRVNLLNVAVSRARDHLVVVGDGTTLRRGRLTAQLIDRAAPLRP